MPRIHRFGFNLLGLLVIGAVVYFGGAVTRTGRAISTVASNAWTCSQGDAATSCVGTSIAPMPTARGRLAVVTAPGGKYTSDTLLYAIGGYAVANSAVLPTFEAYDPTSNSWLAAPTLPTLPTARASLAAVLGPDGQTIYTIGGSTQNQINGQLIIGASSAIEAFSPSAGTWACSTGDTGTGCATSVIVPLPTARVGLAAVTGADGLIYTFGGYNATGSSTQLTAVTFFNYVEAYNPQTGKWICSVGDSAPSCTTSQLPAMPTPRGGLRAVMGSDGQTIYTLGGFTATLSGGTTTDTYYSVVEAFHPQSLAQNSTWACSTGDSACAPAQPPLPPLLLAMQGFGAATAANGAIYAYGGAVNSETLQVTNANDELVPNHSLTLAAPTMPTGRRYLGGTLGPDGLIYAIGGTRASQTVAATDLNTVEAFQPPTVAPAAVIWLPSVPNVPGHSIYLPLISN